MRALRALPLAAVLAFAAGSAPAQAVRILQEQPLRAERSAAAEARAQLAVGREVELLQMSGGWAQVRAGTLQGWVRAGALDMAGAEVGAASRLDTGRRAAGNTVVTLGVRALPPRATRHALIVGVGIHRADAARPVPALPGVRHDMASALAMAQLLQVPADHVTLLRDDVATRDGVQQALRELERRVQPGDRVFIYWSGHGSRSFDPAEGVCIETLLTYDLSELGHRELGAWIAPLAANADKLLVVFDAGHSGGAGDAAAGGSATTRALPRGLESKFAPGAAICRQPGTLRSRGPDKAFGGLGLGGQDLVLLSSSRPDEMSLGDAASGGLATAALRRCLQGDARDLDGSGAISVEEWLACAQAQVAARLEGALPFDAQHLVATGNRGFVPAWFAGNPAPLVTAPGLTPGPLTVATPAAIATPPLSATPAAAVPLQGVLEQIHAQRDGKRRVEVTLASDTLRIGVDALDFGVTSSHDGHVYIALLGSDGQSLTLLFPNELDGRNRIAAGESMLLPRAAWRIVAGGPKGDDTLLVMVTDGPRDLTALAGGKAGPFARPLTDAAGRARLQWLLGTRAAGGAAGCTGNGCSDAFGSALVTLHER